MFRAEERQLLRLQGIPPVTMGEMYLPSARDKRPSKLADTLYRDSETPAMNLSYPGPISAILYEAHRE